MRRPSGSRPFAMLGISGEPQYFPSRKGRVSRKEDLSGIVHDEASITTIGVLVVFIQWMSCKRRRDMRVRAFFLATTFLQLCMLGIKFSQATCFELPDDVVEACSEGDVEATASAACALT